jgi:plasmid replication initiation protein
MSETISKSNFYVEGKEIVISKSNALIEGAYDLSPAEHDLLTLAINKLHKQRTNSKQVFITAREFAIANQVSEKYAYEVLKETAKRLHERKIKCTIYVDEDKKIAGEEDIYSIARPKGFHKPMKMHFNWLQAVAYQDENGFIYLMFSDPLAYLISKTGEAYTKYDYFKTNDLNGFHTKRLYELVNKWKGASPTNGNKHPQIVMATDEWKDFFGCADKYSKLADFKRRVLLPAIKQINEQNDFTLTLKQEKVGRNITHFMINIKDNKKKFKDPFENAETVDSSTGSTGDSPKPLSPKTADMFGNLMGYDDGFGGKYGAVGEAKLAFISRIKRELQTVEGVRRYALDLQQFGYKSFKPKSS